jgi:hypothetical protein
LAVAIDGEIFQEAYLAPLNPETEIYLIPKIGGGRAPTPRLNTIIPLARRVCAVRPAK